MPAACRSSLLTVEMRWNARRIGPGRALLRLAVISDIHGNWHALDAVLGDVETSAVDEIWCLGDIVGYGPQPNRCVEVARTRSNLCLLGNHDLAAIGQVDLATFSPDAATSARWTIDELE